MSTGTPSAALSAPNLSEFSDQATLTYLLKGLFVIAIFLDVAALASTSMEISLLQGLQSGSQTITPAVAAANDARQGAIAIVRFVIFVLTAICFLCWIYRANKNARQLGATDMRFTPGWAVGWFFVPFANWWKPYGAMKEIWQASVDPASWQTIPRPEILPWWWACFVIGRIALSASVRYKATVHDISGYITSDVLLLVSAAIGIPAAVLAIVLVRDIARMQLSHARRERV
jgi:hypothetical protein